MRHPTLNLLVCAAALQPWCSLAAEGANDVAGSAPVRMLKSDYRIAKDKLEADYRAAKRACEALKEAEERDCAKAAHAVHERAERELRAAFYGDRRN